MNENLDGASGDSTVTQHQELLRDSVRLALSRSGTGLEAAGEGITLEAARNYLRGDGMALQLHRLETVLPLKQSDVGHEVMSAARQALSELASGDTFSNKGRFGFEALILLSGRPVLRTVNGDLDLEDPLASEWKNQLYLARRPPSDLAQRIAAVGRIDVGQSQAGTGFVVGPGLVLTNRHVIQAFAEQKAGTKAWSLGEEVSIDFADTPNYFEPASRFRILRVVAAGPEPIHDEGPTGWTALDAALLQVEIVNAAGRTLPSPIPLSASESVLGALDELLVVGYPARPETLPTLDGNIDEAVVVCLGELFDQYGVRTVAPGKPQWRNARDRGWAFPHDATTLNGSSGSCVLSFYGQAIGLHFGGQWRRANYAHGLARLRTASTFLTTETLAWAAQ